MEDIQEVQAKIKAIEIAIDSFADFDVEQQRIDHLKQQFAQFPKLKTYFEFPKNQLQELLLELQKEKNKLSQGSVVSQEGALVKAIELLRTDTQSLRTDTQAIKTSLDIVLADMLDPWEGIHSETESVVVANETLNLNPVSTYYGMKHKGECMVLGHITHSQITCAHIWPRYTRGRGLEAFELSRLDVNSSRNFLRLHKSIERAFDHKRLTFVPVSVSAVGDVQMEVVVLDPALLTEDITYSQITLKFSTLHHKLFNYVFKTTKTPFTRLLSAHTIRAYSKGKAIGWPEAEQHEAEARASAVDLARRSLGEESYAMKSMFN